MSCFDDPFPDAKAIIAMARMIVAGKPPAGSVTAQLVNLAQCIVYLCESRPVYVRVEPRVPPLTFATEQHLGKKSDD